MMSEEDFLQKVHQLAIDRARYILNRDPAPDLDLLEQRILASMRLALSYGDLDLEAARAAVNQGFGPWSEADLSPLVTAVLPPEEQFLLLCNTWAFFTVIFRLRITDPSERFLAEEELVEAGREFYAHDLPPEERADPRRAVLRYLERRAAQQPDSGETPADPGALGGL